MFFDFFGNQTERHIYKLLLIKLSVDISDISFLLDSFSKAKIFPNFSTSSLAGSFSFKRFWNVRLSHRCYFIVTILSWKMSIHLFSIFLSYSIKISVFDKF